MPGRPSSARGDGGEGERGDAARIAAVDAQRTRPRGRSGGQRRRVGGRVGRGAGKTGGGGAEGVIGLGEGCGGRGGRAVKDGWAADACLRGGGDGRGGWWKRLQRRRACGRGASKWT